VRRALLAIDLGTGSVKALIVDAADGRIIGQGAVSYPIERPVPGAAEQSPDRWWDATCAASRQAIRQAGSVTVAAIGLSGQMHGTVLLDSSHRPIGNAIIWADTRSAADAGAITVAVGRERLLEVTGSPVAAGFQAATLHWLRRTQPERRRDAALVLLPKDYLRFRMTGAAVTEPSDAASTLLLDRRSRSWSPEMLDAVGIGRACLPEIRPSGAISGLVHRTAARDLGVPEGTPVVGGAGDAPAAALGAGVTQPGELLLTISTGAQVLMPLAEPQFDPLGRLHTFCAPFEPGSRAAPWYVMGATMAAGLAMRWLRDDIFALNGETAYDEMTALAATVPIGASGLLFLPYLAGERTPHLNPAARGDFIGLDAAHGRAHLTRAVMDGVSLAMFDAWSAVREVVPLAPDRIVLAGGGARSRLWRQMLADLFGLPVRPLHTAEQSAYGAALLAASALGDDPSDLAHRWVEAGDDVPPDPAAHQRYQELVPLFRDAYRSHIDLFERLAGWRE
jgi:xylulokinase